MAQGKKRFKLDATYLKDDYHGRTRAIKYCQKDKLWYCYYKTKGYPECVVIKQKYNPK